MRSIPYTLNPHQNQMRILHTVHRLTIRRGCNALVLLLTCLSITSNGDVASCSASQETGESVGTSMDSLDSGLQTENFNEIHDDACDEMRHNGPTDVKKRQRQHAPLQVSKPFALKADGTSAAVGGATDQFVTEARHSSGSEWQGATAEDDSTKNDTGRMQPVELRWGRFGKCATSGILPATTASGGNNVSEAKKKTFREVEAVKSTVSAKRGKREDGRHASLAQDSIPGHVVEGHGAEEMKLPPSGFGISAAVYTNPVDGLSYFWNDTVSSGISHENSAAAESSDGSIGKNNSTAGFSKSRSISGDKHLLPQIPFLDCNAVGSTTAPLPFKSSSLRHLPCGADPAAFTPTPYPGQLLICLSNIQLIVSGNNEETRFFRAGDVILLEDTVGKGHKIRSCCGGKNQCSGITDDTGVADVGTPHLTSSTHEDMNVLFLTLRHPTHHHDYHRKHHNQQGLGRAETSTVAGAGGKRTSRGWSIFKPFPFTSGLNNGRHESTHPCKMEMDPSFSGGGSILGNGETEDKHIPPALFEAGRRWVLGGFGLGASCALTYWLAGIVPWELSVLLGGGCLVVGGTCMAVTQGELAIGALERWKVNLCLKKTEDAPVTPSEEEESRN